MYQKDQLVVIPTETNEPKYLNINNYAYKLAETPNSFNIFIIDACRVAKQVTNDNSEA